MRIFRGAGWKGEKKGLEGKGKGKGKKKREKEKRAKVKEKGNGKGRHSCPPLLGARPKTANAAATGQLKSVM